MAKRYRAIKFTYNGTTEEIDIPSTAEEVAREDLQTIRQAADGTRYTFVTGYKRRYVYSYNYTDEEVFDFFFNAFEAFSDGLAVLFERELDDGSFESMQVIVRRPQYSEDSIGATEKVYASVNVELLEI